MESRIKTMLLMRDYKLISAIDPKPYADRFIIFMKDKVLIDSKENAEDKAKLSFLRRQRSRRVELENEWNIIIIFLLIIKNILKLNGLELGFERYRIKRILKENNK